MTAPAKDGQPLRIKKYSEATIPLKFGDFQVTIFRDNQSDQETIAIHKGLVHNFTDSQDSQDSPAPLFTRIHSECLTGEVLSSLKCDCKDQLDMALSAISKLGHGMVIYLRQEGRGIGLGNKILAYDLQNKGLNTIDANRELGFENDLRDFSIAGLVLKEFKIDSIHLNTNNPDKIDAIKSRGINVVKVVPSHAPVQEFNREYLTTKRDQLGHLLESDSPWSGTDLF